MWGRGVCGGLALYLVVWLTTAFLEAGASVKWVARNQSLSQAPVRAYTTFVSILDFTCVPLPLVLLSVSDSLALSGLLSLCPATPVSTFHRHPSPWVPL